MSLRTRRYREAEHRAVLLDQAWERALTVAAVADEAGAAERIKMILRDKLREALERDLEQRMDRPPGQPVYAHWWEPGDPGTATEADLEAIRQARQSLARDIAENRPDDLTEDEADALIRRHGLPPSLRPRLVLGLMEAGLQAWNAAERRTLGAEPLVYTEQEAPPPPDPPSPPAAPAAPTEPVTPAVPTKPKVSKLVEPYFTRRETLDRTTHQVMNQERGTISRFMEVCGDRPVDSYNRGDIDTFLGTLRRLPTAYGKSQKDKDRSLANIIAEADAKGTERLTEKTVKRHMSALSQFFQFAVDRGHLSIALKDELTRAHRFRLDRDVRDQRDAWTSDELARLFASPVWRGSQESFRSQPGPHIIRDAKFWLPLLALFHGARLEEFADLYRRDIGCEDGTWFVRITETEDRRLKTANAERVVPLHPEVIRMGFLDYVAKTAPNPDDPLFPDLEPQGKDRKRGPRITRWFVEYRRAIGVYREGVGMHAFRHTVRTRLGDCITGYQMERHVDFMLGHGRGGSEGRQRYEKRPDVKATAKTLALLAYPEIDLSHLYVSDAVTFA
jgi:integrase